MLCLCKACSWMTLLACVTRTLCMWTPILNKSRVSPRRLCTVRLTRQSPTRTRKVGLRFGYYSKAVVYNPYSLCCMRDRLCAHVHRLTFDDLWNRHWESLRFRHLSPILDSDSPRDQGELRQGSGWSGW